MEAPGSDDLPGDPVDRVVTPVQQSIGSSSVYHQQGDNDVKEAQQRALEAVEAYHNQIATKLVGQALEDSAVQVCKAVQELIEAHSRDMDYASERNMELHRQLEQSIGAVEELTRQLNEMKRNPFPFHTIVEACGGIEKASQLAVRTALEQPCPSGGADDAPSQEDRAQPSGDLIEAKDMAPIAAGIGHQTVSDADITAVLAPQTTPEAFHRENLEGGAKDDDMQLSGNEQFMVSLLASHAKAQAVVQILRDDREHWKKSMAELENALQGALDENTQCREELDMLKLSAVSLEEYKSAVEARDAATYELEVMKLKVAELEEDLERLRSPEAAEEAASRDANAVSSQELRDVLARLIEDDHVVDENKEQGLDAPHEGMWNRALRDLDEQANSAAEHRAIQDRREEAERRLEQITAENRRLESTVEDLQKVNEALRLDAQALVYRNSVLSQQVASLLVKVEHLRRELKRSGKGLKRSGEDGVLYAMPSQGGNVRQKNAAKSAAIASEVLQQRLMMERSSSFTALPGSYSQSSGSSMETPTSSFSFRPEKINDPNSLLPSFASQSPSSCLPGTTRSRGIPMSIDYASSTEETPAAATSSFLLASLDVPFLPFAEGYEERESRLPFDKLRVERGLRRTLNTFSSPPPNSTGMPKQRVTLRNFGGETTFWGKPRAVRLPACDQLSGVAYGRPSSHLLLDPHEGSFSRQGSNAELASVLPPGQPLKLPVNEETEQMDPAFSAIVVSPKRTSAAREHGDLISTLALLDADEELDRYSVNTVSELVVRNQELLKELYIATQRADALEAQLGRLPARAEPHPVGSKAAATADEAPQSIVQKPGEYVSNLAYKRVRYDENAAFPHTRSSLTSPGGEDPTVTRYAISSSPSEAISGEEVVEEETLRTTPSATPDEGGKSHESANSSDPDSTDAHALSVGIQNAVMKLIETELHHYDARTARLDGGLAASLLRVLHAKDATEADLDALEGTKEDENGGLAEQAVFQPLVEVCASQAGMIARQAVELVRARQEAEATLQGGLWRTSQQILQQAVQELRELLGEIVKSRPKPREVSPALSASDRRKRPRGADIGEATTSSTGLPLLTSFDEVALLERVEQLLQIALDKEDTTLRAYQAAQRRQRHFIASKEKKLRQLAAKVQNALRQQQLNASVGATGASLVLSPNGPAISSAIPLPKTLTAGAGAASSRSPVVAPSLPSAKLAPVEGLPASTAIGSESCYDLEILERQVRDALAGRKEEGPHGSPHVVDGVEDGVEDIYFDQDSDIDDTTCGYLREQLAKAQTKLVRLTEELNKERDGHVELSARMWQLEVEREDALAARKSLEARIESMWTREQYEGMIAELDAARATIEDRDAQLASANQEKENLRAELNHYQERYSAFVEENRATVKERDLRLANQELHNAQLVQECTQHKSRIVNLVKEAEARVQVLADMEKHNTELEQQLSKVKHILLSEDRTQATLLGLYPGNALVEAHTQLVHVMREECEGLEARMRDLLSQFGQTKAELLKKDTELRQAVQKCQETENRLEEALYFIAQKGLGMPHHLEGGREDLSALDDTTADKKSEEDEDATPWITSKKKIQELQACVEVQEREIERLQGSEAAWKLREEALRMQLDAMSRDPMSEIVRRYGLKAVKDFEAMIEEMQGRVVELQTQVDVHTAKVVELEATLRQAEDGRTTAELRVGELQKRIEAITAERDVIQRERQELKAALETQKMRLEAQDTTLSQLRTELSELECRNRSTEEELEQCVAVRDKFHGDNCALVEKVDELVHALAQAEAEKRAANAAAAQSARASRFNGQGRSHYHPRIGAVHTLRMRAHDSLEADPNKGN
ncbi:unnamed protein product [Phytomonas sp. EM1]|nr:unnamed protein product [Phytomonas sp. EM1]|eukprot:CCW65750.1 unnamed protein product [Phytomonas sp. isolate EM1]